MARDVDRLVDEQVEYGLDERVDVELGGLLVHAEYGRVEEDGQCLLDHLADVERAQPVEYLFLCESNKIDFSLLIFKIKKKIVYIFGLFCVVE